MKRRDLIKLLEINGFELRRNGKHATYYRGAEREEVPNHREIDEDLAKAIIKRRGLK